MAELITRWTKEELAKKSKSPNTVTAYRAGYLPQERRDIENRLKNKDLIGVVSTNALELGIDIGSLDSVIISGYPGPSYLLGSKLVEQEELAPIHSSR